ncbi:helix-turn-helix domain-containing protein [Labrenzia sp. R4_2]|uniref:helix-turn-helix domain-containing protein n=1 Tax=Labrenzia sp. R4_2 TaxID=2821107 RepID=UPI001AD954FF|nr:helix-turn-helix domain-containing protein [Labrenzia sp. R4_2]MBO9421747.1 helix-turn-helix domain-containing protein [Labrenzia sp. R4_2]
MIEDTQDGTEHGLASRIRFVIGDDSLRNFALKSGVKEGTLRSVMKGTRPSIDFVTTIANATGVSLEWLATGTGRPYSKAKSILPDHGIDRGLFEMISQVVEKVIQEEKIDLSPGAIAATVIDYYDMVFSVVGKTTEEEYRSLMPWVEYGIRKGAKHHRRNEKQPHARYAK